MPPQRFDTPLLRQIVAGHRVSLPFDEDLLVVDALEAETLSITVACLVRVGLARLPTETVTKILAFAIQRRLVISPYIGPMPRRAGTHRRYYDPSQLWGVRQGTIAGIPDHNSTFSAVCPYALGVDEVFFAEGRGQHSFGIGLVTEDHDAARYCLRFNPEAVVVYQGIEMLSMMGETEIKYGDAAISSNAWGALGLSLHECPSTKRRYMGFWAGTTLVRTYWLPDHIFLKPSSKRPGQLVQCYAAFQIWANGTGHFHRDFMRLDTPPPPPPEDRRLR